MIEGKTSMAACIRAAAGAALLVASMAGAQGTGGELARAQETMRELETQLHLLLRAVPPSFDQEGTEASIRDFAKRAGIETVRVRAADSGARLPLDDGRASGLAIGTVDLDGRGAWLDVALFLRTLRYRPVGTRIETLRVIPVEGGDVQLEARLAVLALQGDLLPPASHRGDVLAAINGRIGETRALVAALSSFLDPMRNEALDAVAAMGSTLAGEPVALTALRFDGGATLDGLLVGTPAKDALLSALARDGLAVRRAQFAPAGRCQRFSLELRLVREEPSAEFSAGADLFDGLAESFCTESEGEPKALVIGASAGARPALRLRDLSFRDVFFVLNDLIAESYIVDGDVEGRISLEAPEGATVEDVLGAIASAGVAIGAGPLKRVSRTKPVGTPAAGGGGEPVNVTLRDAGVSDVLCLIGNISGRAIAAPPYRGARISVYATEIGVDDLRNAVIAAARAGANEAASEAAGGNPCDDPSPPRSRLASAAAHAGLVVAADLQLAGLARVGDSWRAYVRVPGGHPTPLEVGGEVRDAKVASVSSDGITLALDAGGTIDLSWVK